jgi:hypothetical protein
MNLRYVLLLMSMAFSSVSMRAADNSLLKERVSEATTVMRQIMMTPDEGIPNGIVCRAACIGVIRSKNDQKMFQ